MEHTQYITRKRAKFYSIGDRQVNIPYGTSLEARDGAILYKGVPLCGTRSENAHRYFSQNDDGIGRERGELVEYIIYTLAKRDKDYQARWDRLWKDERANLYRNAEYRDFWLWGQEFYDAPVDDLKHIAALVGGEVRKECLV